MVSIQESIGPKHANAEIVKTIQQAGCASSRMPEVAQSMGALEKAVRVCRCPRLCPDPPGSPSMATRQTDVNGDADRTCKRE